MTRKRIAPNSTCWVVLIIGCLAIIFIALPLMHPANPETETHVFTVNSPHPYPDNANLAWPVEVEGVKRCRVQFSRLEVEEDYDFVILNSSTTETRLSGNYTDGCWSGWVTGTSFTLRLTSDHMTTGWGFRAVAVEVELAPVVWEPAKWIVIGILLVIAGIAVVLLVMWLRRRES